MTDEEKVKKWISEDKKYAGEFEELLDKYFEKFGRHYPRTIGRFEGYKKGVENIKKCLKDNKEYDPPKYDWNDGNVH